LRFGGAVLFQTVKIFQKEQPGGLFSVIQLCSAAGFFAEGVIDVSKGLFEHE
jgi:hypothetical protein